MVDKKTVGVSSLITMGLIVASLVGNTSAILCGASSAGAIYYNNATFLHYGCNSTNWNVLY